MMLRYFCRRATVVLGNADGLTMSESVGSAGTRYEDHRVLQVLGNHGWHDLETAYETEEQMQARIDDFNFKQEERKKYANNQRDLGAKLQHPDHPV